jgi:hypothetical protein
MRIALLLILLFLLPLAQALTLEQHLLIQVDLMRPVDPDAEHFRTAQRMVEGDIVQLFDALEENPKEVEYAFDRLNQSLDLLAEEAGYKSLYVQKVRSVRSYRTVKSVMYSLQKSWDRKNSSSDALAPS